MNPIQIKDKYEDHATVWRGSAAGGAVLLCLAGDGEEVTLVFSHKQSKKLRKALKAAEGRS